MIYNALQAHIVSGFVGQQSLRDFFTKETNTH